MVIPPGTCFTSRAGRFHTKSSIDLSFKFTAESFSHCQQPTEEDVCSVWNRGPIVPIVNVSFDQPCQHVFNNYGASYINAQVGCSHCIVTGSNNQKNVGHFQSTSAQYPFQ